MINKQKLWFLTLFSLILVLSVYYVTMPSDLFDTQVPIDDYSYVVNIEEENSLSVLRTLSDEEMLKEIDELKLVLTDENIGVDEKNNAYEKIKKLEETKGKEAVLESKIKEKFDLDSFVKINNNQIKVVISSSEHSYELANNIIRCIQDEYNEKMYISVKFQ